MVLDPTPPIHLLSPMYWCHSGVSGGDGMEAIRYHEPGMVYLCNCFELWYMCCWHALRFHCAFSIVMRVLVSWVLRAAEPVLGRRFQVYCIRAWLIATTMLIQDCAHSNCSFLLVLEFYIEVNVYWLQLEFFFFFWVDKITTGNHLVIHNKCTVKQGCNFEVVWRVIWFTAIPHLPLQHVLPSRYSSPYSYFTFFHPP